MTESGDGEDPAADKYEAALALLLAALLAKQAPVGRPDLPSPPPMWLPVLHRRVEPGLRTYLTGVGDRFVAQAARPFSPGVVRTAVDTVVPDTLQQLTVELGELLTPQVGGTESPLEADPDLEVRRRRVGSAGIARWVSTGPREYVRHLIATDGKAVGRVWRSRRDARVRPAHGGLEGEYLPVGVPFTTFEGDELRFPGDRLAPKRAWRNCRCSLSWRF